MQSPKRCRGSMSQSNDGLHLSPTWIRSEYLGVPVPSLEGDSTATARLPAPDGTAEGDAQPVPEGRRDAALRRAAP